MKIGVGNSCVVNTRVKLCANVCDAVENIFEFNDECISGAESFARFRRIEKRGEKR